MFQEMSKMHNIKPLSRIAILACVFLAAPFLFFGGPTPTSSPIYPAAWNLGHIFLFALVAIWSRLSLSSLQSKPNPIKFVVFSGIVLILGMGIEWAQYGLDRHPDWHDIGRNQLGASLGWLSLSGRTRKNLTLVGLLVLVLIGEVFLIGQVVWNDWKLQNQLPLICALEEEADTKHWAGAVSLSRQNAAQGTASLEVQLSTDKYSGTQISRIPRDWRGYEWLAFDILIPDGEEDQDRLSLTLVVYDKIHYEDGYRYDNRFNTHLSVNPGWNHIRISLEEIKNAPANRQMDMTNMFHIGLFTSELKSPRVVYLDYFRLE
jgi:hypothetical protein